MQCSNFLSEIQIDFETIHRSRPRDRKEGAVSILCDSPNPQFFITEFIGCEFRYNIHSLLLFTMLEMREARIRANE